MYRHQLGVYKSRSGPVSPTRLVCSCLRCSPCVCVYARSPRVWSLVALGGAHARRLRPPAWRGIICQMNVDGILLMARRRRAAAGRWAGGGGRRASSGGRRGAAGGRRTREGGGRSENYSTLLQFILQGVGNCCVILQTVLETVW